MTKTFVDLLVKSIFTSIIAGLFFSVAWIWGGVYERLRAQLSREIVQLSFEVKKSDWQRQTITHSCPIGELVSASCLGKDDNGYLQAAVGPEFDSDRSFRCHSYGGVSMDVQATALCYTISGADD